MRRTFWLGLAWLTVVSTLAGCTDPADPPVTDGPVDDTPAAPSAVVWGGPDAPLRPGSSLGGYCTFNFLFADASGKAYIGTAGHCTEDLGERVELAGQGQIGKVVFDSDVTEGADGAVDFSLIQLDGDWVAKANPTMLGTDGPVDAVTRDELAVGDQLDVHGYGMVLGDTDATRHRSGFLTDWDDKLYRADMPAVNGDSGAPLLHAPTGKAFGIISHYGLSAVPPTTDEGPIMPFILEELAAAGFTVSLATA